VLLLLLATGLLTAVLTAIDRRLTTTENKIKTVIEMLGKK
jgi:hypothetical protein